MIDIISHYRHTEPIFKNLEEETGTCVLCEGLFLSLGDAARASFLTRCTRPAF